LTYKYAVTVKPGLGSLKVIRTDTDRSAAYDFLLTFHSNHGPISYRFSDKRQFENRKIFLPLCILRPPLKGFSWNWISSFDDQPCG